MAKKKTYIVTEYLTTTAMKDEIGFMFITSMLWNYQPLLFHEFHANFVEVFIKFNSIYSAR